MPSFFSASAMSFILLMAPTPELSDLWGIPVKLFFDIYLSIDDTGLPCMEINFNIITFAKLRIAFVRHWHSLFSIILSCKFATIFISTVRWQKIALLVFFEFVCVSAKNQMCYLCGGFPFQYFLVANLSYSVSVFSLPLTMAI